MDCGKEITKILSKIQSERIQRYIHLFIADIPKRYWR